MGPCQYAPHLSPQQLLSPELRQRKCTPPEWLPDADSIPRRPIVYEVAQRSFLRGGYGKPPTTWKPSAALPPRCWDLTPARQWLNFQGPNHRVQAQARRPIHAHSQVVHFCERFPFLNQLVGRAYLLLIGATCRAIPQNLGLRTVHRARRHEQAHRKAKCAAIGLAGLQRSL